MFRRLLAGIQAKAMLYLGIALGASLLVNGAQLLLARAARADHAAQLAKIEQDRQAAIAENATQRADQLGQLTLAASNDAKLIHDQIKALADQVGRANRRYQEARHATPLPADCRADAERVRAVNAARGQE